MTKTVYQSPGKLLDAYAMQDADGAYIVVRVYDGHMAVTPYTMPKEQAERHAAILRGDAIL